MNIDGMVVKAVQTLCETEGKDGLLIENLIEGALRAELKRIIETKVRDLLGSDKVSEIVDKWINDTLESIGEE